MKNKQLYEKQSNQYNPFFPIVRLDDIIETISDKSIKWILNNYNHIYVEYNESPAITRNKVPQILRRNGLWISYNNGKKNITEYYIGENTDVNNYVEWTLDDNWKEFDELTIQDKSITYQHLSDALRELVAGGNTITNFPDEEDITTDGTVLSFKDRNYEPDKFSGLGRVILRKNIKVVDGQSKNILTQGMINKENTIYEIRYDFNLNGAEITVPEGCVLDFQGGSLSNGSIEYSNTTIKAPRRNIVPSLFKGNISNEYVYIEWFGAIDDGVFDNTSIIQNVFNSVNNSGKNPNIKILFSGNIYRITNTIYIPRCVTLMGDYVPNTYTAYNTYANTEKSKSVIFADFDTYNFVFDSAITDSDGNRLPYYTDMSSKMKIIGDSMSVNIVGLNITGHCYGGVRLFSWVGGEITNVSVSGTKVGITIGRSWNTKLTRISITTKIYGLVLCGEVTTMHLDTVQCTYKRAFDHNIELGDTKYLENKTYAFKDDIDWINTSTIAFVLNNSNVTMTNCVGEIFDVSVLAMNCDLVLNGYYAELNYKAILMLDISNVIVNSLYGTNSKSAFSEEEWLTRYYDYSVGTRSQLILNNCVGGSISHPFVGISTNEDIFNTKNITINSENLDLNGYIYFDNQVNCVFPNLPEVLFIDDTVEDDTNNWGFSKKAPIRMNTYLKRLSNSYSNIYKNGKFKLSIIGDAVVDESYDIHGVDLEITSDNENEISLLQINSPIGCSNVNIKHNNIAINSTSSPYRDYYTIDRINDNQFNYRKCTINSPRLYTLNKGGNISINISACTLNEDIVTIYSLNTSVVRNININSTNCNIPIDDTNNYKCNANIPSLNKKFYNGFSSLPALPAVCTGYTAFCNEEQDLYIYIVDKWISYKIFSASSRKKYGTFEDKPTIATDNISRGYCYYCTNKKSSEGNDGVMIFHQKDDIWIDSMGNIVDDEYPIKTKGSSDNRPILETSANNFQYFDTTLNKPIWWTGSTWVDATGTEV